MKPVKLAYWNCHSRINTLREFREQWEVFLAHSELLPIVGQQATDDEGRRAREWINHSRLHIAKHIHEAGVSITVTVREPQSRGGGIWPNYEVFENIFTLRWMMVSDSIVLDTLDTAIGYYERELRRSVLRTLNPLWWLARLGGEIIIFPFKIIEWAGFDSSPIEWSLAGKIYKVIAGFVLLVPFIDALLGIFVSLDLIDSVRQFVIRLFS